MPSRDQRQKYNRIRRGDQRQKDNDPQRVYHFLRSAFRRGLLNSSESVSESALVTRFGATRESVRRGLQEFVQEGLLRRQPRSGTWFTEEPGHILGDRMFPLLRGARNDKSTIVVLDESLIASSRFLREIMSTEEVQFVRYEQLILYQGLPSAVRTSYAPRSSITNERISDLQDAPYTGQGYGFESDFELIFDVPLGRVEDVIEAGVSLQPIPPLGVEAGDVLLNRETLAHDHRGVAKVLSFTSYKASIASITLSTDFTSIEHPAD